MKLIVDFEFFIQILDRPNRQNKIVQNIFFNQHNKFILNSREIDFIEQKISLSNREIYKELIVELSDENRIENIPTLDPENFLTSLKNIINLNQNDFIIPVKSSTTSCFNKNDFDNLIDLTSIDKNSNRLKQLIMDGCLILSYQDFSNNAEVKDFLSKIFNLHNKFKDIVIFNRDTNTEIIDFFKNKKIYYYTLETRNQSVEILKDFRKDCRKNISPTFKILHTKKRNILHERKIYIDYLCISFDNAFCNIRVEEPTWEISIWYNKEKSQKWMNKKSDFKMLQ